MPSSAVYSGVERFMNNNELTAVTFAEGVTTIGQFAFWNCSSLMAITIPDGVTSIAEFAFNGCSSLEAITIPDSVTRIGYRAFRGCFALTKLSLYPAVSVGEDCFLDCTALISAAANQNMPTVKDFLNSRWQGILERVAVLSCLKTPWIDDMENQPKSDKQKQNSHLDGDEVVTLQGAAARKRLPKVMWRVILEFL